MASTITPTAVDAYVRIEAVRVVGRHRRDLGDLSSLVRSISTVDLLNPITLTRDGRLVAGQRRLEACRRLGWTDIPVRFVDSLDDAAKLLAAERDENVERKEMLPSELASLGEALYELEAADAKDRQGTRTDLGKQLSGNGATKFEPGAEENKTRTVVGEALGMSGRTYSDLRYVYKAATDPATPEPERVLAEIALEKMDRTGGIGPAAREFRRLQRAKRDAAAAKSAALAEPEPEEADKNDPDWIPEGGEKGTRAAKQRRDIIREMAQRGYTSVQIGQRLGILDTTVRRIAREENTRIPADEAIGQRLVARKIDSNRIVRETVASVENVEVGLDLVAWEELDRDLIPGWIASLSDSIAALNRLKKRLLKETAQ